MTPDPADELVLDAVVETAPDAEASEALDSSESGDLTSLAPFQEQETAEVAIAATVERRTWSQRLVGLVSPWMASAVTHLAFLLCMALWVLPQLVQQGVQTVSATLDAEEAGDFAEMADTGPRPRQDALAGAAVFQVLSHATPLENLSQPLLDPQVAETLAVADLSDSLGPLAMLRSSQDLGQEVRSIRRRAAEATGDAALLGEATGIDQAVEHATAGIRAELADGELLVVWLLDQSLSLVDDRQEVARRLEPFYREIESRDPAESHRLMNAVVGFGAEAQELVKPTKFGGRIVAGIKDVPVDPSGLENVFSAISQTVARYRKKAAGGLMLVVWTDESGDDLAGLEPTIELCRQQGVTVSVIGPTAVMGREAGIHVYLHPDNNQFYWLAVKRGPESALPERLRLPYWWQTELPAWHSPPANPLARLPAWHGGAQLEGMLSGFGPYSLVRLARETGGTFTILDRPGDQGPFRLDLMRPYLPDYAPAADCLATIQVKPLRLAVLTAAGRTFVDVDLGPPPMSFFGGYQSPPAFRNRLKAELPDVRQAAQRAAETIEQALAEFGPEGMEEEWHAEYSPRWRAWHDLTRGRLLAMSVRYAEYQGACQLMLRRGFLQEETNSVSLRPFAELRTGEQALARAKEAERLLSRCISDHAGTPWAYLAQRELDHALGLAIREVSIPRPAPQPAAPAMPGRRGGGGKAISLPNL